MFSTPLCHVSHAPISDGGSSSRTPNQPPGFETSTQMTAPLFDAIFGTRGYATESYRRFQPTGMTGQQVSWPIPQPTLPLMPPGRSGFERGASSGTACQPGFHNLPFLPQGLDSLSNAATVATGPNIAVGSDLGPPNSGVGNFFLSSNIWSVHPTNFVTTKLSKIKDFLSWRTQFTGLLIVHQVQGFVDSSVVLPLPFMRDVHGQAVANPDYNLFLQFDQCIRMWLLATIFDEVLTDIRDLAHSWQVWD